MDPLKQARAARSARNGGPQSTEVSGALANVPTPHRPSLQGCAADQLGKFPSLRGNGAVSGEPFNRANLRLDRPEPIPPIRGLKSSGAVRSVRVTNWRRRSGFTREYRRCFGKRPCSELQSAQWPTS
jgi:hypothetical protein